MWNADDELIEGLRLPIGSYRVYIKGTESNHSGKYGTEGSYKQISNWNQSGDIWISDEVKFEASEIGSQVGIILRYGEQALLLYGTVVSS